LKVVNSFILSMMPGDYATPPFNMREAPIEIFGI